MQRAALVALAATAGFAIWSARDRLSSAAFLQESDLVRGGVDWLPVMDRALVEGLGKLFAAVDAAGGRAFISPHSESLGRNTGSTTSQHYTGDGVLRAADVMIEGIDIERAYNIARNLAVFSGIGAYTDTKPAPMLHVDVRKDRGTANPAVWSRVAGVYGSPDKAFS